MKTKVSIFKKWISIEIGVCIGTLINMWIYDINIAFITFLVINTILGLLLLNDIKKIQNENF